MKETRGGGLQVPHILKRHRQDGWINTVDLANFTAFGFASSACPLAHCACSAASSHAPEGGGLRRPARAGQVPNAISLSPTKESMGIILITA